MKALSVVTVDSRNRVSLRGCRPGDRFQLSQDGESLRLDPVPQESVLVEPVMRDGHPMFPGKISREQIHAAIRADRDAR